VVPPFNPAQLQLHGPLPLTAQAEPVVQSPLVGLLLTATPFAEPHAGEVAEPATASLMPNKSRTKAQANTAPPR
jgi:hypothetical protein